MITFNAFLLTLLGIYLKKNIMSRELSFSFLHIFSRLS